MDKNREIREEKSHYVQSTQLLRRNETEYMDHTSKKKERNHHNKVCYKDSAIFVRKKSNSWIMRIKGNNLPTETMHNMRIKPQEDFSYLPIEFA